MKSIVEWNRPGAAALILMTTVLVAGVPAAAQTPLDAPPVPESAVRQAERQAQGEFGELERAGAAPGSTTTGLSRAAVGGQVQEVWNEAPDTAGVYERTYCAGCTYKVRLREYMVTVVELPEGETIERADVGDGASFEVHRRGERRLSVRPLGYGVDTNLMVFGRSGAVYPFYLRAERFNSRHVPDLLVRITALKRYRVSSTAPPWPGGGPARRVAVAMADDSQDDSPGPSGADGEPGDGERTGAGGGLDALALNASAGGDDFVAEAPFDPNALRGWGDYEVWGGGADVEALKPVTVFRDDHFTYVRFEAKWTDLELPAAYVVVDGIDELVNTRIQGRTFIIESTRALITLKSGASYVCLRYGGAS